MLATIILALATAAQPNTPPPAPPQKAHGRKIDKAPAKNSSPDAELIGFLGDYEDAADGLDPIGLSEPMIDDTKTAADANQKDAHGP